MTSSLQPPVSSPMGNIRLCKMGTSPQRGGEDCIHDEGALGKVAETAHPRGRERDAGGSTSCM